MVNGDEGEERGRSDDSSGGGTSGTVEHELVPDAPVHGHGSGDRRVWFVAAAVLVVVAMAGATIAVVSRNGSSGNTSTVPLSLFRPPNFTAVGAAIGPDGSEFGPSPYEYHHDGGWPDLGSNGTVYRLGPVDLSEAQITTMASALGVQSAPAQQPDGWMVDDGSHQLQVHATESGSSVIYTPSYQSLCERDTGPCGPVDDSGSSSGWASSGPMPSGTAMTSGSTDTTVAGATTSTLAVPPSRSGAEPADLPDEQSAQGLAHDLLGRMGVLDGDWRATVANGAMMAYACAISSDPNVSPRCPTEPIVVSRTVTFTRVVGGRPAEGFAWYVEIGDSGMISSVYGLTATIEKMAEYPLITPAAAYDEIVGGDPFAVQPMAGIATSRGFATVGSAVAEPEPSSVPTTAPPGSVDSRSTSPGAAPDPTTTVTGPPGVEAPPPTISPEYVPGPATVIEVTGVERALSVAVGSEDGKPVAYLVPSYHFTGSYDRPAGFPGANDWSLSVVAVDRSLIQPLTDMPSPDGPPVTSGPVTSVPQPVPSPTPSTTVTHPHDVEPCGPTPECVPPSPPTSASEPSTTVADSSASPSKPGG